MNQLKNNPFLGWSLFIGAIVVALVTALFASSIMERRAERTALYQVPGNIADWESDNAVWGKLFPREYETWKDTIKTDFRSKHGGSAEHDLLEEHPEMVVMWAGYAFSREYNEARGHAHSVEDIQNILRTGVPQPGTCWTCKSPDVPRLMNKMGPAQFYSAKWSELGHEVKHSIGCLDCHDPKTMNLRISRPALIEAFQRQGKDITQSTHQEMRSLVCAQCHVEYYFRSKQDPYLTFPWDKGIEGEQIEAYYDERNFTDWVHTLSKAPMLKAQHPDWEIGKMGIHMQRGLSCADCHMPYKSEGGVKFTDHKIESPLNKISYSCKVCHNESEQTLIDNVAERQDKIIELRKKAQHIITQAHIETKVALDKGATEEDVKNIHKLIRSAQWRWDFVVASLGGSFHAPLESARLLGSAIEKGQEARIELQRLLSKLGVTTPVPYPDISTKAKAQAYIGLDMNKLNDWKTNFKQTILPQWKDGKPAVPEFPQPPAPANPPPAGK